MSSSLRVSFLLLGVTTVFAVFGIVFSLQLVSVKASPSPDDLKLNGWIWSSNYQSFISFCGGRGSDSLCPGPVPYQVIVNNSTGHFSGYAFVGIKDPVTGDTFRDYMSFNKNEIGTPPQPPFDDPTLTYTAKIDPTATGTKKMEGWGRFLSACDWNSATQKCQSSGAGSNSGGWDGWVRFSEGVANDGTPYDGFVATKSGNTTGLLVGYAWGADNVGWISASTSTNYNPPPQATLPSITAHLIATPTSGFAPITVTLRGTIDTSSTLDASYHFFCDTTGNNSEEAIVVVSSTEAATFPCHFNAGSFKPFVTVDQGGVFGSASDESLVTNASAGGSLTFRRGVIREIAPDE